MKKLMIAAAIVCAAAMSQAATVQWKATGIQTPGTDGKYSGTTASTKGSVSGYLYDITGTQYSTWLAALNTTDWEAQQTAMKTIYDTVYGGKTVGTGDNSGNTKGNVTITDTRDISSATKEKPVDLYSAIIYTYTDGDGKDWYVANVGKLHFEMEDGDSLANLNTKVGGLPSGSQAIQGWMTAVPEPTSGLLLLLGVAGLALKRKRA